MEETNPLETKICGICSIEKKITSFIEYGKTKKYRRKVCKNCENKGLTMKDATPPKETRECPACSIVKPINQFYRNNALPSGYEHRCKICHNNRIKIPRDEPKIPNRKPYEQKWENYFNIVGVNKNDYAIMYKFLEKIGYDLSKNIHEQFCLKWGVSYKEPKKPFKNTYSPTDCNLF